MIRLLGNKEHELAYNEAEKQAAEAKVAEQERVTLEKAAQERIAAEGEAKAIVDKIEQERVFAENKAKAATGYPLNGMSVEEIVQSLTDGAFSNISTLPSLDTYRKALRILCTSESPVASAFLKERHLRKASFAKGDLIQKVETGESQKWEGGGQNYNSISLAPFPSDKGKKGFTGSTVSYPKDQLRLLDHESMQIYDLGDSASGGLSKQNGMDRGGPANAKPMEGDVVVHKESGAVSIVYNSNNCYDSGHPCFVNFPSLGTQDKWTGGKSNHVYEEPRGIAKNREEPRGIAKNHADTHTNT